MKPRQKFSPSGQYTGMHSQSDGQRRYERQERGPQEGKTFPETTKKIGQDWIQAMTTCQFPESKIDSLMTKLARVKSPEEKVALVEDRSQWGETPEEVHARFTATFWVGLCIQTKIRHGYLPEYFRNRYSQTLSLILRQLLPKLPPRIQKEAPLCRLLRNGAL